MPRIEFEGQTFDFPDDFTDEEISTALSGQTETTAPVGGSPPVVQDNLSPEQQVQTPQDDGGFTLTLPTATAKEALLDPGALIAESVLKGITGLGRGLLTFPEDIVRQLAGPGVSEEELFRNPLLGLTKTIGDIGRKIPQIRGGTSLGNIGGDIFQFGAPAGAVGKTARALIPGKGNALANLAGMNVADVTVADPTQDQSFIESSGATRDLTPLERRLAIGAEGTVVGGALGGIAALMRQIGRGFRPFHEAGVEKEVAGQFQESVTSPPGEIILNIDKGLARQEVSGFQPTTGTLTGDPGLLDIEKGVISRPELIERAGQNRQALSQEVQRTLQAGGDPQDLTILAQDVVAGQSRAGQQKIRTSEQILADSRVEVENLVSSVQGTSGGRGAASEQLSDELQTELRRRTLIKNQKFEGIDPSGIETINKKDVTDLVASFKPTSKGDLSGQEFLGSRIAKSLRNMSLEDKAPTFKAINDLRPTVAADIQAARVAGKGDQIAKLEQVRDFINNQADVLAKKGGEAGVRAQEALDFFRNDFAPFFGEGAGKEFRKGTRTFAGEPTQTAAKFLRPSIRAGGAKESSTQLASIIANTPEPTKATQAVRDFIIEDLGVSLAGKTPEQAVKTIKNFIATNADNLNAFPAVKKEIDTFVSGLEGGLSRVNKLGDEILDAKKAVKDTDKKEATSAFAKLAKSDNPVKTLDGILKSDTGITEFDKLYTSTQKNKLAREGLRASLSEALTDRIVKTNKFIGGEVNPTKLNEVLKDKNVLNALNKAYKKSDIDALNRVQKRVREADKINLQVSSGSPTAGLVLSQQRVANIFASVYGIAKGRGLFTLSKILVDKVGGNPTEILNKVIARSMVDPVYAKMLLSKRVGDSNKEARRVALYTINNVFTEERE